MERHISLWWINYSICVICIPRVSVTWQENISINVCWISLNPSLRTAFRSRRVHDEVILRTRGKISRFQPKKMESRILTILWKSIESFWIISLKQGNKHPMTQALQSARVYEKINYCLGETRIQKQELRR